MSILARHGYRMSHLHIKKLFGNDRAEAKKKNACQVTRFAHMFANSRLRRHFTAVTLFRSFTRKLPAFGTHQWFEFV